MYLRQLVGFLIRASGDHRVGLHHVELYIALFQQWVSMGGRVQLQLFRYSSGRLRKSVERPITNV